MVEFVKWALRKDRSSLRYGIRAAAAVVDLELKSLATIKTQ
jgi:hypothetical protein